MDCNCYAGFKKKHEVIRSYVCVGEYMLCGKCNRVEWLWLTDGFELELNEKPYLWLNEGSSYGLQETG